MARARVFAFLRLGCTWYVPNSHTETDLVKLFKSADPEVCDSAVTAIANCLEGSATSEAARELTALGVAPLLCQILQEQKSKSLAKEEDEQDGAVAAAAAAAKEEGQHYDGDEDEDEEEEEDDSILLENVLSIAYSCSAHDEKFCISLHVADGMPMLVELLANENLAVQEGACAVLCCCCECGLGEEGESAASRAGNSVRHYLMSSEALLSLVWMLDHASQVVRESSRKSES